MGLLAVLAAKTREGAAMRALARRLPLLAALCVAGALALLWQLPQDDRSTYFSENALLPHQGLTFFRESDWAVVNGVRDELRPLGAPGLPAELRTQVLEQRLAAFGLRAHTHASPAGDAVYAVLRASRGPQNEAVVLAAPWRVDAEFNHGGVAVLLALARSLRKWHMLHKNVVLVFPSDGRLALREWVRAYHTSLAHTAGNIEGALVLEFPYDSDRFDYVDVGFEGLNGQLPNLDLVNVAVHCALAENVEPSVLRFGRSADVDMRRIAVARNVLQQAAAGLGVADYASAMFSGWRIDAVTLRAVLADGAHDITTFGRIAESTFRSVNNLLEHFHQSFFLYLLLGPSRFVSIAQYLPAAMLAAAPCSLMALRAVLESEPGALAPRALLAAAAPLAALVAGGAAFAHAYALGLVVPLDAALAVLLLATAVGVFLPRHVKTALQIETLAALGAALAALSAANFSLALVLAGAVTPLAFAVRGRRAGAALIVAHPMILLTYVGATVLGLAPVHFVERLATAYAELDVYTWPLVCGIYIPAWLAIACACI